MSVSRARLRREIARAYEAHRPQLGQEAVDEMAMPSYVAGNALSRLVFWGKLRHVVEAADLAPGQRVLDFGCGSGVLLPALCAEGREVVATDLELGPARQVAGALGLAGVRFVEAAAWEEAVPDRSLDRIVAANVLEHVEPRPALLATFARKLVPGGRLVVSGPTENALYRLGRRIVGFTGHYHVATVHDVLDDVEAAGLRTRTRRRFPMPGPACLYVIAAYETPDPRPA